MRSTPISASNPSSSGETPAAAAPTKPARGRSAGKFSSGVHNIGLACLRLEQVERWAAAGAGAEGKSDALMMSVQLPGEEGKVLGVRPWIPSWFARGGEVVQG